MLSSEPLTALRDIHLPEALSHWPLAPGFYGLVAILMASLLIGSVLLRRWLIHSAAKRQALTVLKQYLAEYEQGFSTQLTSARVSVLLKRVALVYYPRIDIAGLQGEVWLAFLEDTSRKLPINLIREQLLRAPYQAHHDLDLKPLFKVARQWITQRRKPCLN